MAYTNSLVFGPLTTRPNVIRNLDDFILSNIPYALVLRDAVQWGAIQYDGPRAPGVNGARPALQWHFGGIPYTVTQAVRVYYSYTRTWDSSDTQETAAIYLGFQSQVSSYVGKQAFPYVHAPAKANASAVQSTGAAGVGTQFLASRSSIMARDAANLVTGAPVTRSFCELVKDELEDADAFLADVADRNYTFNVDFDGPAQDASSLNPFQYTFAKLLQEPDLYGQLVFWYFGGKPYRVTKAMRVPLRAHGDSAESKNAQDQTSALFIGYGGLGSGSGA